MPKRKTPSVKALSVKGKNTLAATGCMILFFGAFAAAGSFTFWMFTIRPFWGIASAQRWVETPCTIVSSEIEVHDGDDGDTYSIEIKYDYEYDGRPYRGERYHFMYGMSSSGRSGKQEVVKRYPVGLQTTCYVDPNDPSEAVLNRGLTADLWWGLFSLPFLAVGYGGLLYGTGILGKGRKSAVPEDRRQALSSSGDVPADPDDDTWESDGPVLLKPEHTPLGKFVGTLLATLFWNGLVSIFVYHAAESHIRGRPEWCLTIFLIPFVLIGLLLIWAVGHTFLALFIPRPTLSLDRARIPLGETARLSWRLSGRAHIIRHLSVTLEGAERATYRRGTDTHTDKHTFFKETLVDSHDSLDIPAGGVDVQIPADSMHSFKADNNRVEWAIHFKGEIPLRPDIDAEFRIKVTPHEQYQR